MKKIIKITVAVIMAIAMLSSCTSAATDTPEAKETDGKVIKSTEKPSTAQDDTSDNSEQNENASASEDIIEPEQLISQDKATELIGETANVGEKTEQAVVGLKMCMYEAADKNSFEFLQISLTQQAFMPESGQTPQSIYDSIIAAFDGGEKVDGIGDTAVFATPGLHIMANGYYISIGAGNLNDEAVRETLKQAGALAVKNLETIVD